MASIFPYKTENGVGKDEAGLSKRQKKIDAIISPTACFAASEIFGKYIYDVLGGILESYVAFELTPFLAKNRVAPNDLYIDPSYEGVTYLGFLKPRNPKLPNTLADDKILGEARPDILIHTRLIKEFYEIKPNSNSGRAAGKRKVQDLNRIYSTYNLPYSEGSSFIPPDHIEIGSTSIVVSGKTIPVEVSFGLLKTGALILYDVCITTNWKDILVVEVEGMYLLLKALLELLQAAFARAQVFIEKTREAIAESTTEIVVIGGIALLLLLVLTSEVTIPATLITAILEFFSVAVLARI